AVHVAERLHRTTVSVEPTGRAGDEALPAEAALAASAEAERDQAVRGAIARCEFTLVLRFFGHSRQRHEDTELRYGERVRGFFGIDRGDGLAVDRLGTADRALHL